MQNIDAESVIGVNNNAISLANGFVCCQIRDDLIESVDVLLARPERIEYILFEARGVADPSGIFATFTDANLRDRIGLHSVICVGSARSTPGKLDDRRYRHVLMKKPRSCDEELRN